MSENIKEKYKAINLMAATTISASANGTGVDVEIYEDDALVVVSGGGVISGSPSVVNVVKGSLPGTPTTYDQTLATFGALTANSIAAARVNLFGIKNVRVESTLTGSTSISQSVVLLAKPGVEAAGNNSSTFA